MLKITRELSTQNTVRSHRTVAVAAKTIQPSQKWFALNPTDDGPFNPPLQSVLSLVRNQHQCLISEIAFDSGDPIPTGVTPFTSDKLAQRNLTLVESANPGDVASRRIPSTFELKPTSPHATPAAPDELMIDWGNAPTGSVARMYLPTVSADEIVALAAKRYSKAGLARVDAHTIECPVQRITYVPIPPGPSLNHTGLLTIDLPAGVRKGQLFKVVVRQVTRTGRDKIGAAAPRSEVESGATYSIDWRTVLGAFQISIPVKTKDTMLVHDERLLAVLRWILLSIPHQDRWYQVFLRYVSEIADRVRGLGGTPDQVPPSATGDLPKTVLHPAAGGGEARFESTGKITGLVFDHFGDFEGFLLDTEDGERKFFSREKEIEELAERAWRERLRITVWAERHEPHRPSSIIVREPPAPFGH